MATFILFAFSTLFLSFLLYYLLFGTKMLSKGQVSRLPPGPKGWPILGNLPQLGAQPHVALHSLSKIYGPLFRLRFGSYDVVVATTASVASQFLRDHDTNFSSRPPNGSAAVHLGYNFQNMISAPYGPRWRLMRKLCALHLFSPKAVDDLRSVREAEVAILARALYDSARSHTAANLGYALTVCTTNALSKAMIGIRVFSEDEESKDAVEFKDMVFEVLRLVGTFNVGDFVPALRWLDPQGVVRDMKKVHRRFDSFIDKIIEGNRRAGVKGDDLLSVLMRLKEEAEGEEDKLTDPEIRGILMNMFSAGTDTASNPVEWAISELIRNPEIREKAQMELDSVVGRDRLVREADLHNLPFLQAVVKETYRLHTPIPLSLPRAAAEACEVNGFHIPANITLVTHVWAIARDPAVWADPLEFRPARFLPGGGHEDIDVKGANFEVIPFGAGRRTCPGVNLGVRMAQLLTATLIHAFDWALPGDVPGEKLNMEESFRLILLRAVPLVVHPIPRLAPKAYEAAAV